MKELFRDRADFLPTLRTAAERLEVPAAAVEKDYWVSQVLRRLASEFDGAFVFKGGTSLQKAYGLIARFSEDIDILVLREGTSKGATDRLMKQMAIMAAEVTGGESKGLSAEKGVHRSYGISYLANSEETELLQHVVLLEMGTRGGPIPSERVSLSPLLSDPLLTSGFDVSGYEDLQSFEVRVLHPARTLVEKLCLIHVECQRLERDAQRVPDPGLGRHFYDVHQLLDSEHVKDVLSDGERFALIMRDVEEITRQHFLDDESITVRPGEGFASCSAFNPLSETSKKLRSVYETTMPELLFGSKPLPQWESMCARVAESRELL